MSDHNIPLVSKSTEVMVRWLFDVMKKARQEVVDRKVVSNGKDTSDNTKV